MGKSGLLERQRIERKAFFDAGLRMGRQQILDMMCLALNDPDIMGKDTFGKDRILKVITAIGDNIDFFQKAWERHDETDYYRVKLDEALARIYGERLEDSFLSRYDVCADFNYKTGRWSK